MPVDPEIQRLLDDPIRSADRAGAINVHRIPREQRVEYRNMRGPERATYRALLAERRARQLDIEDAIALASEG